MVGINLPVFIDNQSVNIQERVSFPDEDAKYMKNNDIICSAFGMMIAFHNTLSCPNLLGFGAAVRCTTLIYLM